MNQLFVDLSIGLISHRKIQPCFLIYNTFIGRTCAESVFSVIRTHTALAESSESHFTGGKVDDRIVDTSSAESTSGSYFSCRCFIRCKDIKSQRVRHGIDFVDCLIKRVIGQNRKYRTEDFFLHDRIVKGYMIHDGRFDFQCCTITFSTEDNLGGIYQFCNTVKMLFIDNLSIIFVCQRLRPELSFYLAFDFGKQLVLDLAVAVNIIGGYAGLPAI